MARSQHNVWWENMDSDLASDLDSSNSFKEDIKTIYSIVHNICTYIREPSSELTEPSSELTERSNKLTEPSNKLTEPSSELTEPSNKPSNKPRSEQTDEQKCLQKLRRISKDLRYDPPRRPSWMANCFLAAKGNDIDPYTLMETILRYTPEHHIQTCVEKSQGRLGWRRKGTKGTLTYKADDGTVFHILVQPDPSGQQDQPDPSGQQDQPDQQAQPDQGHKRLTWLGGGRWVPSCEEDTLLAYALAARGLVVDGQACGFADTKAQVERQLLRYAVGDLPRPASSQKPQVRVLNVRQ